jgi:hypothetical protein
MPEHEKESEREHVSDLLTATDYEVPPPGQYRVRIEEVQKRDGRHGPYYRVATKVVGGDFDDMWVSFVASAKLSPAAKLRIAIEDIEGRKLKKGAQYDPQSLKGCVAIAEVSNKTEDERTYANIDKFFPVPERNGLRAVQEEAHEEPAEVDESDFEDMPF